MGKVKVFFDRYIKGCYHCDTCPMCWSDWSYEGDCDAGCYIFGDDLRDTCRLIPPLRWLIGWPKKKYQQYWNAHQYDDCGEYFEKVVEQDLAMESLLRESLRGYEIYSRDWTTGELIPQCKDEWVCSNMANIRFEYEQKCHPYTYTPLKKEWKNVLSRTWNAFWDIFRPYFYK